MSKEDLREPVRRNIRIPADLDDWLRVESKRTAIPVSSLISIAVSRYHEQAIGISNASELVQALEELNEKVSETTQ